MLGGGRVSETFSAWPASTSTVSVNLKIVFMIILKIIVKIIVKMILRILVKMIVKINY